MISNTDRLKYGGIRMAKYEHLEKWHEFSLEMEQVPFSSKKLAVWIDYYLWQGGKYSEIESRVKKKAEELPHGGYKFPGNLFNSKEKPQGRTFLGHIAARVIDEDLLIEIEGNPIDSLIEKLSLDEKSKLNVFFKNLCENQNAYIRIEGFKGKPRPDMKEGNLPPSGASYLPTKNDVELVVRQIPHGVKLNYDTILDQVEKNMLDAGKILKDNWRIITEENIANWFK